jgi:hypothetical protein
MGGGAGGAGSAGRATIEAAARLGGGAARATIEGGAGRPSIDEAAGLGGGAGRAGIEDTHGPADCEDADAPAGPSVREPTTILDTLNAIAALHSGHTTRKRAFVLILPS